MPIIWRKGAVGDLERIHDHLVARNERAAERVTNVIDTKVTMLERFPMLGRPGRVSGTRELIVAGTPYIVAYRVKGGVIDVLAVIHSSRRWPTELPE